MEFGSSVLLFIVILIICRQAIIVRKHMKEGRRLQAIRNILLMGLYVLYGIALVISA